MNVKLLFLLYTFTWSFEVIDCAVCEATLVMGSASPDPGLGVEIDIDCAVRYCADGYSIDWKKWVVNENGVKAEQLTLYRFSPLGHEAVDRGSDYDIKGRTDYFIARDKHSLYIKDLFIKDNGTWTCDVIISSDTYTSNELNIIIPVRANVENVTTQREEIVDGQTEIFRCNVSRANPAPYVEWNMTGKDDITGESVNKIVDGYWSVHSTTSIHFSEVGMIDVICTVGSDDYGWVSKKKEIIVKERASIDEPSNGRDETIDVNSSFNFDCKASGYKPRMKWRLGNEYIDNGPLYNISSAWDDTSATSILISKPLLPPYDCDIVTTQQGIYTCEASLEPPYQHSISTSPDLKVEILYAPLSTKNDTIAGGLNMEMVLITCSICASEPFRRTWTFNEKELDAEIEVLTNGSLLIPKVNEESFGIYTQTLQNDLGTSICTVKLDRNQNLDVTGLSAGAIAGIVIAVLAVISAPILIFIFITHQKKKKQADEEVVAYAESGNASGALNDGNTFKSATTDINTSSTSPVYSEVHQSKKKKQPSNDTAGADVYSDVNKDKKKKPNTEEPKGPVYSQVNKTGRPLPLMKPTLGNTNTGPVYSEVKKPKHGHLTPIENKHYDNSGKRNEHGGLHYADVDFLRQGHGSKQSHGTKNPSYEPTEYAQIDHRKSTGIVV